MLLVCSFQVELIRPEGDIFSFWKVFRWSASFPLVVYFASVYNERHRQEKADIKTKDSKSDEQRIESD